MDEKQIEQTVLTTKIVLTLTVGEINKILAIISKYPFEEVSHLIGRIHEEGQPQINKVIADLQAASDKEASNKEAPTEGQPTV